MRSTHMKLNHPPSIKLLPGREKSLLRRHPWIFSGAIDQVQGVLQPGETVQVLSSDGNFLAWAGYSPSSQIRARVWSWNQDEKIDQDFFRRRLARALEARKVIPELTGAGALRLLHGESDGIPGVILDRYDDTLVVQFLTAPAAAWQEVLVDLFMEMTGAERLFERSDVETRQLEGLKPKAGLLRGTQLEGPIEIQESPSGLRFLVDIRKGHKTGFYLDQRSNRSRVRELAVGRRVLDCFCYTGGFTINALVGGAASVVSVDSSAEALAQLRLNLELNQLPLERANLVEGDVFQILRLMRDMDRSYDLIVLDPPKFAQTAAQAQRAARGYKDINLLALKLLRPGGLLVTFSCSGGVSEELFQKIVAGAAVDAWVDAQILERLHQGPDHPVSLSFPEGAYLKGLVLRV
jgi:23S rRNA (cytosine1962-C5)-methyltransferase